MEDVGKLASCLFPPQHVVVVVDGEDLEQLSRKPEAVRGFSGSLGFACFRRPGDTPAFISAGGAVSRPAVR